MQIDIPDAQLDGFNSQAKMRFRDSITTFWTDLHAEVMRLESSRRGPSSTSPEVTSAIVSQAEHSIRDGFAKKKRSKLQIVLKIIVPFSWTTTGLLLTPNYSQETWFPFAIFASVAVAVLSSTVDAMGD